MRKEASMAASPIPGIAQLNKDKDAIVVGVFVRHMIHISLYLLGVVPSLDCHVSFGIISRN